MVFDASIFNQVSSSIYTTKPNNFRSPKVNPAVPGSLFNTNPVAPVIKPASLNMQPTSFLNQTCDVNKVANSMIKMIDAKDSYTGKHSKTVQKYTGVFTSQLGLPDEECEQIKLGAVFHDIGKVGVKESTLNTDGPLNNEQYEEIKKHPKIGYDILKDMPPFNGMVANIALSHHEEWQGGGYPKGLQGDQIPLGARIVAIVDSYHAMTSDRPYRKGMPKEKASSILNDGAGKQWDPELVKEFNKIIPLI